MAGRLRARALVLVHEHFDLVSLGALRADESAMNRSMPPATGG
jgi:hypothetical protein